jgi:uncharacterized radical SAM superfamily protein
MTFAYPNVLFDYCSDDEFITKMFKYSRVMIDPYLAVAPVLVENFENIFNHLYVQLIFLAISDNVREKYNDYILF